MSYATNAELIERFGETVLIQLADRQGSGLMDAAALLVIDSALADATAKIDSHLAKRYSLPLASVPSVLVPIACSLAFYYLCGSNINEERRKDFRDAERFLESLGAGSAILPGIVNDKTVVEQETLVSAPSRVRVGGWGLV